MTPDSRDRAIAALLASTMVMAGCTGGSEGAAPRDAAAPRQTDAVADTDRWLGQWNGPEGTFLRLDGGNGRYTITIRNLDGPRTFAGTETGARIQFDRDGVKESIHASDGSATGMKWLREKADCLTIRPGEGYCRD